MDKEIFIVKGNSGSGKSTRTFVLIKFLYSLGFIFEDYIYNGKKIGIFNKDLFILFLGKFYKSSGIERWQGYDSVTSCFKGVDNFDIFLKESKFTIYLEGSGIVRSHRLRPDYLCEKLNFSKISLQYYNFYNECDFNERIKLRKGSYPNKNTGWSVNSGFISDYNKSLLHTQKCEVIINENLFDENLYDLGCKFIDFLGFDEIIKDKFIEYCKKSNYISLNNFNSFNNE